VSIRQNRDEGAVLSAPRIRQHTSAHVSRLGTAAPDAGAVGNIYLCLYTYISPYIHRYIYVNTHTHTQTEAKMMRAGDVCSICDERSIINVMRAVYRDECSIICDECSIER
jgi:hypothetical protein